jgi:hypothetical protein
MGEHPFLVMFLVQVVVVGVVVLVQREQALHNLRWGWVEQALLQLFPVFRLLTLGAVGAAVTLHNLGILIPGERVEWVAAAQVAVGVRHLQR